MGKKFYTISPINVPEDPHIFPTFISEFEKQGHSFTTDVNEATICFFDFHSGLFNYDWSIIGDVIARKLPVVCFDSLDHWTGNGEVGENVYDFNNLPLEKHWAKALHLFIQQDLLKVVFIRKMSKAINYPPYVFPLELFQYPDCDFPPVTKDELLFRQYDFCFIGNLCPIRKTLATSLSNHFKVYYLHSEQRIPHDEWIKRHRQAKFFIECGGGSVGGGGFGSERVYQLITTATMLRCRNEQLILNNWEDGIDCVEAGDCLGNVSYKDVQGISYLLNHPDKLYDIYIAGIERMHKYFNKKYRANFVLSTLHQEVAL